MPDWLVAWMAAHNGLVIFLVVFLLDWGSGIRLAVEQKRFRWREVPWGLRKLWWLIVLLLVEALVQAGVVEVGGIPVATLALLPLRYDVGPSFIQNLEALGYRLRLPASLPSKREDPPR